MSGSVVSNHPARAKGPELAARPNASILVVDDESVVRRSCERVLSREGTHVSSAGDATNGLAKLRSEPFDVVLLDLKMPGIGGIDLLKAIRKERPEIIVVIITGYPTASTAVEALKLGAFDYILKPFSPEELSAVVMKALEHKRAGVGPKSQDNCRRISHDEVPRFIARIAGEFSVWGPIKRGDQFVFDRVTTPADVALAYPSTILPPKKLFSPQRQCLMRYTMGAAPVIEVPQPEAQRRVVLGLHPCDLHALNALDTILEFEYDDTAYRELRKRTLVVGVDCEPRDSCFCVSMGTNEPPPGTDLFLTAIDGGYLVEMGSPAGARFLGQYADTSDATAEDILAARQMRDSRRSLMTRSLDFNGLGAVIQQRFDDDIWDETAKRCLGCTSCSLVCPMCYCFNVVDTVSLDLQSGQRERHWDSCILQDFATVAGGHNFRDSRGARLRNWFYHKFRGLPEACGVVGCVGCGRCIAACPAGIDLTEVVNLLRGERHETAQ
jgi:CheY-like chemotaxis protein/ferredoxin